MGSLFGDWPSYNPHNFSQLRPSDPSHPLQLTPATYYATHNRTIPPANQVISTEVNNILLRHFHQSSEQKVNSKRPAQESPAAEHASKQLKSSSERGGCSELQKAVSPVAEHAAQASEWKPEVTAGFIGFSCEVMGIGWYPFSTYTMWALAYNSSRLYVTNSFNKTVVFIRIGSFLCLLWCWTRSTAYAFLKEALYFETLYELTYFAWVGYWKRLMLMAYASI